MDELVSYRLDDHDCITAVGGSWTTAAGNAAAALTPGSVIGRPLWAFIRNRSLQDLYRSLFDYVRASGQPLSFPYRCDSPEAKRYLRMTLMPLDQNGIEISSRLLNETPRLQPLAVQAASRGEHAIPRCSVCNRFRVDDRWREVSDAVVDGLVLDRDRPVRVIHSVCGDCRRSLQTMTSG